jgi:hypothetical protein
MDKQKSPVTTITRRVALQPLLSSLPRANSFPPRRDVQVGVGYQKGATFHILASILDAFHPLSASLKSGEMRLPVFRFPSDLWSFLYFYRNVALATDAQNKVALWRFLAARTPPCVCDDIATSIDCSDVYLLP